MLEITVENDPNAFLTILEIEVIIDFQCYM